MKIDFITSHFTVITVFLLLKSKYKINCMLSTEREREREYKGKMESVVVRGLTFFHGLSLAVISVVLSLFHWTEKIVLQTGDLSL